MNSLHCPVNAAENDHDPHGALDPVVEPLKLGACLLTFLLVHGLFQWLNEGLDRRRDGNRMAGAHGNNNLVGLKLDILDISESGGEDGHKGRDVQTGRALLKAGSKDTESGLSQWKGIVDGMLEGTHIDHTLHLEIGKLIQRRQDVFLHQSSDKLRRMVDSRVDHEQGSVLDHDILFLEKRGTLA